MYQISIKPLTSCSGAIVSILDVSNTDDSGVAHEIASFTTALGVKYATQMALAMLECLWAPVGYYVRVLGVLVMVWVGEASHWNIWQWAAAFSIMWAIEGAKVGFAWIERLEGPGPGYDVIHGGMIEDCRTCGAVCIRCGSIRTSIRSRAIPWRSMRIFTI